LHIDVYIQIDIPIWCTTYDIYEYTRIHVDLDMDVPI